MNVNQCEMGEVIGCVLCGSDVSLGLDCAFATTTQSALCFSCAVCRGGVYDEARRTWVTLPDTTGLQQDNMAPRRYFVSSRPPRPPERPLATAVPALNTLGTRRTGRI
jgi:hypothetical protein